MRKTNVRQHTRKVKGRPVNVVHHERRVQEQLGRIGATSMSQASKVVKEIRAKKAALPAETLADDFIKSTVSFPTALFREPPKTAREAGKVFREEVEKRTGSVDEALLEIINMGEGQHKLRVRSRKYGVNEEMLYNQNAAPFMKQQLTELDVHLLSRRMNDGKITEEEAIAIMPRDGWELEADQVEKGRKWLNNIWKNRYGLVKTSSPFEHKQEAALQSFRTAKLVGMESDDGSYFYPRYRIIGTEGQFDYSVKGGNIRFY